MMDVPGRNGPTSDRPALTRVAIVTTRRSREAR